MTFRNQQLPSHELRRGVDRLDRLNGGVRAEMEHRKRRACGRTAKHGLGGIEWQAGDLQAQLLILRAAPRGFRRMR